MSKTIQTTLHAYHFYINEPEGKAAYAALVEKLNALGLKCFETHGGDTHHCAGLAGPVELETAHLFDNQWSTAPRKEGESGHRVFDWAQDYRPNGNRNLKRGHWIEQTEEMRIARELRYKCGYCSNQMIAPGVPTFCPCCLDSQYLKSTDLHLTRMQNVMNDRNRAPLTDSELAKRLPLYKAAQLHGTTERGKARIAGRRASLLKKRDSAISNANTEYDGMTWLMDRGISEEPIFYSHTGRFCFGWRDGGVDAVVKPDLLAALDGFPFPFDVK